MCPGVFADGQVVPVPCRSRFVVLRDLLNSHRARLSKLGRQNDYGEIRTKGKRQINNANLAICDVIGECQ